LAIEESDHRHRGLLRAHGKRPSRCAAEKGYEFTSSQASDPHMPRRLENRVVSWLK
jgi:hypothetical protein